MRQNIWVDNESELALVAIVRDGENLRFVLWGRSASAVSRTMARDIFSVRDDNKQFSLNYATATHPDWL